MTHYHHLLMSLITDNFGLYSYFTLFYDGGLLNLLLKDLAVQHSWILHCTPSYFLHAIDNLSQARFRFLQVAFLELQAEAAWREVNQTNILHTALGNGQHYCEIYVTCS